MDAVADAVIVSAASLQAAVQLSAEWAKRWAVMLPMCAIRGPK